MKYVSYTAGFFSKCAEAGLTGRQAVGLYKIATGGIDPLKVKTSALPALPTPDPIDESRYQLGPIRDSGDLYKERVPPPPVIPGLVGEKITIPNEGKTTQPLPELHIDTPHYQMPEQRYAYPDYMLSHGLMGAGLGAALGAATSLIGEKDEKKRKRWWLNALLAGLGGGAGGALVGGVRNMYAKPVPVRANA